MRHYTKPKPMPEVFTFPLPLLGQPMCAVVVAYGAQGADLNPLLQVLVPQVERTIVVVNPMGDDVTTLALLDEHRDLVEVVQQAKNLGLPAAQNVGIRMAKEQGARSVLFLDQDSLPRPDMVHQLQLAWQNLQGKGVRVGALGCAYEQPEGATWRGFVRMGWSGFKRRTCESQALSVEADFLISSGTLIPMDVLDAVGPMEADLFIDHVDTEWCLRARSKGFALFGVCAAKMHHILGESRQKIWWFGARTVSHHSPFRYYYMFRNSWALYPRAYIPLRWKCWDLIRNARLLVFMALFSEQRMECLRMMWRGSRDGWRGRKGPLRP
jgi:rhamnosyltransferase